MHTLSFLKWQKITLRYYKTPMIITDLSVVISNLALIPGTQNPVTMQSYKLVLRYLP